VFVEGVVRRFLDTRAKDALALLDCNAEGLLLFSKVLARIESETFYDETARGICSGIEGRRRHSVEGGTAIGGESFIGWTDAKACLGKFWSG